MKKIDNVVPLSQEDLKEINGGVIGLILAGCALWIASYEFGYTVGKDLYHAIND